MALLFMDSFDHYSFAQLTGKWMYAGGTSSDFSDIVAALGRRGTYGLKMRTHRGTLTGTGHVLEKQFVTSGNTFICGFAYKCVTALSLNSGSNTEGSAGILAAVQNVGASHVWFRPNGDGTITALCGSTPLGTTIIAITQGVYAYIEMKVVIAAAAAGSVVIRINGSNALNVTGVTTQVGAVSVWNGFASRQRLAAGTQQEWNFDDFYLSDGSGAAPWNDLLGDCRVELGMPTAEGAAADWAPLSGTDNADMVKENPADGDTSYVSSITPGHTDTYDVPDSPVAGSDPSAVQVSVFTRKEDAGLCGLAAVARIGTTNYPLPVVNPGGTYAFRMGLFQTNPATGLAWTEAEYNAAQFGFTRAS
jgi:hypothetical protein